MIGTLTLLLSLLAEAASPARSRSQELRGRLGLDRDVDTRSLMAKRLDFARSRYPGAVIFIKQSLWAAVDHPGPHANDPVAGRLVVWLARKISENGLPYREAVLAPYKYSYFSEMIHDAIANAEEAVAEYDDEDLDIEAVAENLWDEDFYNQLQDDDNTDSSRMGSWIHDVEDHDCSWAGTPRVNESGDVVIDKSDGNVEFRMVSRFSSWSTDIESITVNKAAAGLSGEELAVLQSWVGPHDDLESAYDTVVSEWWEREGDEDISDEMKSIIEHLKGVLADGLHAMQMATGGVSAIRQALPTVLDWMWANRQVDISDWSVPQLIDVVFEDHRDEKVAELQVEYDQEREGLADRPPIKRSSPVPLLAGDEDLVRFSDGAMIVDLAHSSLWAEGKSMMHCVGQHRYGHPTQVKAGRVQVFSYRDPDGVPKATLAVDRDLQTIQLQGPHNGPFHDEDGAARMAWFMDRARREDAQARGADSPWDTDGKAGLEDLVRLSHKLMPDVTEAASSITLQSGLAAMIMDAAQDVEQENW